MKYVDTESKRLARTFERSSRMLQGSDSGPYKVRGLWKPDLQIEQTGVLGLTTKYSREGKSGSITYREELMFPSIDTLELAKYNYSNDIDQRLQHTGEELLTFELPANFILDLAHYARLSRLHLTKQVDLASIYEQA